MSFQLENSHHQPQKPLNLLGGVSRDGVLVSRGIPATLDFFDTKKSPPLLQFLHPCPVSARDTFLDSKINQKRSLEDHHHHHHHHHKTMSKRNGNNNNNNNVPKLDLKLNLSTPSSRVRTNMNPNLNLNPNPNPNPNGRTESPSRSASVSPPSSCVSSEISMNSPEATSMVLAGCPRCLMYVMLSEDDPKCPKCKSNVLLDFMHDNNNNNNNNNSNNNSNNNNSNNNNSCSNSGSSKKMKKG